MTANSLRAAISRVVSAYSAARHVERETGQADIAAALQRLLLDELGLTSEEWAALCNAGESRLAAEIYAELTQRRLEECWPHGALPVPRGAPN